MLKTTLILACVVVVYAGTVSHSSLEHSEMIDWLEKLEARLKVIEEKGSGGNLIKCFLSFEFASF